MVKRLSVLTVVKLATEYIRLIEWTVFSVLICARPMSQFCGIYSMSFVDTLFVFVIDNSLATIHLSNPHQKSLRSKEIFSFTNYYPSYFNRCISSHLRCVFSSLPFQTCSKMEYMDFNEFDIFLFQLILSLSAIYSTTHFYRMTMAKNKNIFREKEKTEQKQKIHDPNRIRS